MNMIIADASPFMGLAVIVVAIVAYFLPSFVADLNKKRDFWSIFLLNLFLGWSLIGWVAALIWAAAKDRQAPSSTPAAAETQAIDLSRNAYVAGWQHHQAEKVAFALGKGVGLSLRREAQNQYDDNAIEVFYKDVKLGYLERDAASHWAPVMDTGQELIVTVVDFDPAESNSRKLMLGIERAGNAVEVLASNKS